MRKHFYLLIIFLSLSFVRSTYGQSGAVYSDPKDKFGKPGDTTRISFGVTIPGIDLFRDLSAENISSNDTLLILSTLDFFPERPPEKPIADIQWTEFQRGEMSFPVKLPHRDIRLLPLRYEAKEVESNFPLGANSAILTARMRKRDNGLIFERIFRLEARKIEHPLSVTAPDLVLDFDSVYIQRQVGRVRTVSNDISVGVPVQDTIFQPGNILNTPEFSIAPEDRIEQFPAGPFGYGLRLRYQPRNLGLDEASLKIRTRFDKQMYPNVKQDSVLITMKGVGVKQLMNVEGGELTDSDVTEDIGDTLDFGKVFVNGVQSHRFRFRNAGSLAFGALQDMLSSDNPANLQHFAISGKFPVDRRIAVGAEQEVEISFVPKVRGQFVVRYEIVSDIGDTTIRRVFGTPESAKRRVIILRGQGIQPKLSAAAAHTFRDTVTVLSECPGNNRQESIPLNNNGNALLEVRGWAMKSGSAVPFLLEASRSVIIQPAQYDSVRITFQPVSQGQFHDTLIVYAADDTVSIPVTGISVNPSEIRFKVPDGLTARPGETIAVPILTDGGLVGRANNSTLSISYERSLLKYAGIADKGTAALGATVIQQDENSDGSRSTLTLRFQTPSGTFFASDTLLRIVFDTYLGVTDTTSIAVHDSKLGYNDCPSIFTINRNISSGSFTIDNFCGKYYKILDRNAGIFRLGQPLPNPVRTEAQLEYEVAFPVKVRIFVYNSYGESIQELVDARVERGRYMLMVPTAHLVPGVYFCEMQAGIFREVQQIVVAE